MFFSISVCCERETWCFCFFSRWKIFWKFRFFGLYRDAGDWRYLVIVCCCSSLASLPYPLFLLSFSSLCPSLSLTCTQEYMSKGSLNALLQEEGKKLQLLDLLSMYETPTVAHDDTLSSSLLSFSLSYNRAQGAAAGMKYLHKQNIVHRWVFGF